MDKLQWFKFSPSDWMMGRIQRCDLDTQALFLRLCCIYWNKQCKLSKDDAIFEIDQKHFDILVSKKIIFCNDTNISISFLDEQFMEINEEKQDKSKSGIIGNLKRWHRPIFDSYERKEISLEDAIILSKNNSNSIAEQSHPYSNAIAEQSQIIAEKNREDKDKEQIRKENKENTFLLEKETKNNICEISEIEVLEYEEIKKEKSSAKKEKKFSFKTALLDYGFDSKLVDEWLQVRKTKKAVNTETAFNSFIREIESRSCIINEVLQTIVENSWSGFKFKWVDNLNNNNNNGNGKQQNRTQQQVFIDTANSDSARNFKM